MSSKRIDDLEILRGFAVLAVVVHHAHGNLFTWASPRMDRLAFYFNGGIGVDLFFAISGFVIARDLVPRLLGCTSSQMAFRVTLAFWVRRAFRLLPSAWTWLALTLLAVLLFNHSGAFGSLRANLEATLAGALQVANYRFAETFGRSEYGASFVYWTLSLEEQFYLLLPFVVILSRRFLPYVLVALVLYQLFAERTLMMVVFRSDALALGVLLALWSGHRSHAWMRPAFLASTQWVGSLVLVVGVACLGLIASDALHLATYRFSLLAVISALLVWLASYDMNILGLHGWIKRVLLWIGARSYAIYLIHVPAFFLTREIWFRLLPGVAPDAGLFYPFLFTAVGLIAAFGELNFRLIETPLRRRGAVIAARILAPQRLVVEQCQAAEIKVS